MPRLSADEKLVALEKRKAAVKAEQLRIAREIRGVQSRKKNQAQRDRAHSGIVVGLEMIEHALRNPGSEVHRVAVRIVENHLAKRPDDRAVADVLSRLKAAASSPASIPEAAE